MKIAKTKEIILEEVELIEGVYYFEDGGLYSYKMTLLDNEGFIDYTMEIISNFSNLYGIKIREDSIEEGNELPYEFRAFILGDSGKKIEEEEFYKEKNEVIKRLI